MDWQLISTAPKDGSPVLLGTDMDDETFAMEVGHWVDKWGKRGHGGWRGESNRWPAAPTHWHPLPDPPA